MKILIVDDNAANRLLLAEQLECAGYRVSEARGGAEALELARAVRPAAVITDVIMPTMDGYELARQMKADPRLRDVLIMMITSRTGEKHRQRAFDLGVDRYLGKPYQEPELMRNVHELLKVSHGRE